MGESTSRSRCWVGCSGKVAGFVEKSILPWVDVLVRGEGCGDVRVVARSAKRYLVEPAVSYRTRSTRTKMCTQQCQIFKKHR